MSQAGSLRGGGSGGGSITTISGDTGSITGASVTIFANQATLNSGSSVSFVNSGTVSTFNVTDSNNNTVVGLNSGSAALETQGGNNVSLGALNITNASGKVTNCIAIGTGVMFGADVGTDGNIGIGNGVLGSSTSSNQNTVVGNSAATSLLTGTNNTILGSGAGSAYTTSESNNILIENTGVVGDNHAIKIGTGGGTHTTAFIAGITGVIATGSPVAVSSTGQLSDLGFGTAAQVFTSNGPGVSPTWQAATGPTINSFLAVLTADQNNVTGDGTTFQVPFDSTIYDTASAFTTGASAHYTFPTTGKWIIDWAVCYQPSAASGNLFVNDAVLTGQSFRQLDSLAPAVNQFKTMSGSVVVSVTSGDTLLIDAINSGGTKTTNILSSGGGSRQLTYVSGHFVSA